MATSLSALTFALALKGSGSVTSATGLVPPSEVINAGQGLWPAMSIALAFGTSSGQANECYLAKRTLAATTYDNIDLKGGLTNDFGAVLQFTKMTLGVISLDAPDGTKKLYYGPQGQTHAFDGGFPLGVGATVGKETRYWDTMFYYPAGYAITEDTNDFMQVYNPTAGSISYYLLLFGQV